MLVLAELLPERQRALRMEGLLRRHTSYEFNKAALMAFVSTLICIGMFVAGSSQARAGAERGCRTSPRSGYEAIEPSISHRGDGRGDRQEVDALPRHAVLLDLLHQHLVGRPRASSSRPPRGSSIPLFLALQTWLIFIVVGFKHQGPSYFKNSIFPPGVPKALYILVTPIEFISKFLVRPFSLAVRLFANMAAGHVLLAVFAIMTNELIVKHPAGCSRSPFGTAAVLRARRDDGLRVPRGRAAGLHLHDPHRGLRQRVHPSRALSRDGRHSPVPATSTHHSTRRHQWVSL